MSSLPRATAAIVLACAFPLAPAGAQQPTLIADVSRLVWTHATRGATATR